MLVAVNSEVRSLLRELVYASLEEIATFFERYVPPSPPQARIKKDSCSSREKDEKDQSLFDAMLSSLTLPVEVLQRREEMRSLFGSYLSRDKVGDEEVSLSCHVSFPLCVVHNLSPLHISLTLENNIPNKS